MYYDRYKKLRNRGHATVMIKGGKIRDGKCAGGEKKVCFLVGAAFGKGWCNLGPLDEDGSRYQCFKDDSDSDDEGGDDSGSDDEDAWHIIKCTRSGAGVKDTDVPKRKKAEKKFQRAERKGQSCILVKGNRIRDFTNPHGDEFKEKQLCALIGMAYGKGLTEDLGPLEEPGPLHCFDSDAGSDSD